VDTSGFRSLPENKYSFLAHHVAGIHRGTDRPSRETKCLVASIAGRTIENTGSLVATQDIGYGLDQLDWGDCPRIPSF
jgi:hypothetical protein